MTKDYRRPKGQDKAWDRIEAEIAAGGRDARRAEAAKRNARVCGTHPSWYGF